MESPIRYLGGKNSHAQFIVERIPKHNTYVEPFAGAASVFFAKRISTNEVLNDVNSDVMRFLEVCKNTYEELLHKIRYSVPNEDQYRALYLTDPRTLSDVDAAFRYFYLNWCGWNGYPTPWMPCDLKRRPRYAAATKGIEHKLQAIARRLRGTTITHRDYREILERYDSPTTLFFIDPPYISNTNKYEETFATMRDHKELLRRLRKIKGKFMLCHSDTHSYAWLCRDFAHIVGYTVRSGLRGHNGKRHVNRELLIANFEMLHDPNLLCANRLNINIIEEPHLVAEQERLQRLIGA